MCLQYQKQKKNQKGAPTKIVVIYLYENYRQSKLTKYNYKIKKSKRSSIYKVNNFPLHLYKIFDKTSVAIRLTDWQMQRSERNKKRRTKGLGST